jgi:hypothetical protein
MNARYGFFMTVHIGGILKKLAAGRPRNSDGFQSPSNCGGSNPVRDRKIKPALLSDGF